MYIYPAFMVYHIQMSIYTALNKNKHKEKNMMNGS